MQRRGLIRDILIAVIGAAIGALATFGGNLALGYFQAKIAVLVYETLPPADYASENANLSIVGTRIQNVGNKEVRSAKVLLRLAEGSFIQDVSVRPSLETIEYSVNPRSQQNIQTIEFGLLNPNDAVTISMLVQDSIGEDLYVELRAPGVTGREISDARSEEPPSEFLLVVVSLLAGFGGLLFGLALMIINRLETASVQKRFADVGMRLMRSRIGVDDTTINNELLGKSWRLFFNPAAPNRSKIMKFSPNGDIIEGKNNNEHTWRTKNGQLEFLNSDGKIFSRFYFSPEEDRFFHTNDNDTLSLPDQYMIPE